MKSLYVIASQNGRTADQLADMKEAVRSDLEEALMESVVLLGHAEGISWAAAGVDAITRADIVVTLAGWIDDMDCRVLNSAAVEYTGANVHDEQWVADVLQYRRDVRSADTATEEEVSEVS